MTESTLHTFIQGLPMAELHLHIEGSFEPGLMFEIAARNNIRIPYADVEAVKKAYQFNNLQEFLDIYYAGAGVLIHERDFYDLTWAYLSRVRSENVVHTEIFFDPQTHTDRGVAFETVINGIHSALEDGREKLGISYRLIMSFLRHLDEASAFDTLHTALPHRQRIHGVGLDSSELGNPPSKFQRVFAKAREEGFAVVAHAGEEGPADYIHEALDLLQICRLDHGNRAMEDSALLKKLAQMAMPLTLCPLSNKELKVVPDLKDHPVREMMNRDLLVTINSDDPAYFGGYMNANFLGVAEALDLTKAELITLAKNSFRASWLDEADKIRWMAEIDRYAAQNHF